MGNDRVKILISVILIILLGAIAYSNSINGEFLWDDRVLVKENQYIRNWSNLPRMFTVKATEKFGINIGQKYNFFRPFQMVTYMLDYSLWKLDVRGYHLSNVIFHIGTALTIFWLIILLYDSWLLALLTSLLFVTHPIHTEAVSYISGRADSLAALFMLLSFVFYIKDLRTSRMSFCILACISYVAALLSRENSLILPLLLILYHYSFKIRLKLKPFLPIAGLSLAYIILRSTLLKSLLSKSFETTFAERLPGFFIAIFNYIRLLIAPVNLHMEYGNNIYAFSDPKAIAGVIILLTMLVFAFLNRRKEWRAVIFFSIAWFILTLLPSSNLYPLNAYMAEHWLYIPSIGFVLIVSKGLVSLFEKKEWRIIGIVLALALISFYSILTLKQNSYWKDSMSLYQQIFKYESDSARINFNLGNQYNNQGKTDEAIRLYKKAIEIDPEYSDAYTNLGLIYYGNGKLQEAITFYEKAVAIRPKHSTAHTNLGVAYYDIGRPADALASYERAIALNPDNAEAYNNIGIVKYGAGEYDTAIKFYKTAIEKDPAYARAYSNLAISYFQKKQYTTAVAYFDKARQLGFVNPDLSKALEPYR